MPHRYRCVSPLLYFCRLRELTTKLSSHVESESMMAAEENRFVANGNEDDDCVMAADSKTGVEHPLGSTGDKKSYGYKSDRTTRRCVLTCFFPDGSPLQGNGRHVLGVPSWLNMKARISTLEKKERL